MIPKAQILQFAGTYELQPNKKLSLQIELLIYPHQNNLSHQNGELNYNCNPVEYKDSFQLKSRVYLEKLSSQDFASFYTLTGNEEVMAMITERPLSEEEARKEFNYFLENNELHSSFGSFKVLEVGNSILLGFAKLEITKEKPQEAEIGYMLSPEFWGRGLGNEIAQTLMEVAKSDPNITRVWANTDPNNAATRKILINNGFASEKTGVIECLPSEIFGRKLD